MKLLKSLLDEANVDDLTSRSEQPNVYPEATMDELRRLIKQGTKPNKKTGKLEPWANALELVHRAFSVANVQRPEPGMKELWKNYETLIQYAVKELSKAHGLEGDWRMSASVFHEAREEAKKGTVLLEIDGVQTEVPFSTIKDVLNTIKENAEGYDVKVNDNVVTFWKHNIKQNYMIKII